MAAVCRTSGRLSNTVGGCLGVMCRKTKSKLHLSGKITRQKEHFSTVKLKCIKMFSTTNCLHQGLHFPVCWSTLRWPASTDELTLISGRPVAFWATLYSSGLNHLKVAEETLLVRTGEKSDSPFKEEKTESPSKRQREAPF